MHRELWKTFRTFTSYFLLNFERSMIFCFSICFIVITLARLPKNTVQNMFWTSPSLDKAWKKAQRVVGTRFIGIAVIVRMWFVLLAKITLFNYGSQIITFPSINLKRIEISCLGFYKTSFVLTKDLPKK